MFYRGCFALFTLLFVSSFSRAQDDREKNNVPAQEVWGDSGEDNQTILRAYERPNRIEAEEAKRWITVLLFGSVGSILVMFFLIAFFYEPNDTKLQKPTKVSRSEGFVPYQREREQPRKRYDVSDD
jgi:hypothetical protein